MKRFLKRVNFNFIKVTLTILTVCSICTFFGIFQILTMHHRTLKTGANTDISMNYVMHNLDMQGKLCQEDIKSIEDRLSIIEEQIETLFEFHKEDQSQSFVKKLD